MRTYIKSENLSKIDLENYVQDLSKKPVEILSLYKRLQPRLVLPFQNIYLNIDTAVPCGLIINELVSQCFKVCISSTATRRNQNKHL